MSDQLPLPFVSLVGASPGAPPDAFPEVRRLKRGSARHSRLPLASRTAEVPPAPGDGESKLLDAHDYVIRNEAASFAFPMRGDAMAGAGIFDGEMLIVDQSIRPAHNHIVLAFLNGERLVRRLHHRGRKTALLAEHPDHADIDLADGSELTIWGVVVGSVKRF